MKPVLLSLSLLIFACTTKESEESKQLKEQNALLKKQVEQLETKKKTPPPVNYAEKVSGTYIGFEIEDYVNGQSKQIPSDGQSITIHIDAIGTRKILIRTESTRLGILGGKKERSDTYKASIKINNGVINFTEIWENGEYEAYGTIESGEFVEFTKRRSDGKITSKVRARI